MSVRPHFTAEVFLTNRGEYYPLKETYDRVNRDIDGQKLVGAGRRGRYPSDDERLAAAKRMGLQLPTGLPTHEPDVSFKPLHEILIALLHYLL